MNGPEWVVGGYGQTEELRPIVMFPDFFIRKCVWFWGFSRSVLIGPHRNLTVPERRRVCNTPSR